MTALWRLAGAAAVLIVLAQVQSPGSVHDGHAGEHNRSSAVAPPARDAGAAKYRHGGQFTQWSDEDGPAFWGYCGGIVAINIRSMTPGDVNTVERAARSFLAPVAGRWRITTTRAAIGTGNRVVVTMDHTPTSSGAWGITEASTLPAGRIQRIVTATVHLSTRISGREPELRQVTLHELAHAVGADHSPDRRDITHSTVAGNYSTYTTSEARGLARVSSLFCSDSRHG